MLRGELTGLRAHTDSDIEIFETELLTDVETRIRATGRPWLPVTPGAPDSPYRQAKHLAAGQPDRRPPRMSPPCRGLERQGVRPVQDARADPASRCTESLMCRSSSRVAVAASLCVIASTISACSVTRSARWG